MKLIFGKCFQTNFTVIGEASTDASTKQGMLIERRDRLARHLTARESVEKAILALNVREADQVTGPSMVRDALLRVDPDPVEGTGRPEEVHLLRAH